MAVVKESEPFDWIHCLPECGRYCLLHSLSLLIFQPNVHIHWICLAGNRDISVSQRLLSWQLRLEHGVNFQFFVFFSLSSHRGNWWKMKEWEWSYTCNHLQSEQYKCDNVNDLNEEQTSYVLVVWVEWEGEQVYCSFDSHHCRIIAAGVGTATLQGWRSGPWVCSADPGSGSCSFRLSCLPPPHPRRTFLKNVSSLAHRKFGKFCLQMIPRKQLQCHELLVV